MALEALRDTLVAALAIGALLRLVLVVGSGQFSARSLMLCLMAAPPGHGDHLVAQSAIHRPGRGGAVLKLVCALLVFTGVGLIGPALQRLL